MLTEDEQTKAYATLHAAIRGWADGTLSLAEFTAKIKQLRKDLHALVQKE